jgi:3-carboxy-cis,cis-muconate cycloisomerase
LAGRTLLQQATPLSFGLKAAGWMVALDDAVDRLRYVRDHRLAAQLGGATGTLAGFGGRGVEVAERFAARLGLQSAVLAWHTDRSRLGDVATGLGLAGGVVGKVALDVVLLAQTEVGELHEGHPDRGGSSTMPHKRNPVAAVAARGAVMAAPALVSTLLTAMAQEHERAAGAWHSEWRALTELLRAVGSGASWLADCLDHLKVDAARMGRNLELEGGVLLADRVADALTAGLGRITAHDLVAELSRRATESRRPLAQLLADDTRVRPHLGPTELARLLDPSQALGESAILVERALAHHRSRDTTRRGR